MATVEMAVVASEYFHYLIASEDLEPGEGWDYSFFSVLNDDPVMNGGELGTAIVDTFIDYYGMDSDQFLALSVTDLSNVGSIMDKMGVLMRLCSDSLAANTDLSFRNLSVRRYGTKTFGNGSPRDNECDMVDIGDMAIKLADIFPDETAEILAELDRAVVYNRHNSSTDLKGLSTYYIYGGVRVGEYALGTYSSLDMDSDYTNYLIKFYQMLKNNNITTNTLFNRSKNTRSANQVNNSMIPAEDRIGSALTMWQPVNDKPGYYIMTGINGDMDMDSEVSAIAWPNIDGRNVCLYEINNSDKSRSYAIPASLNDVDCDIIVLFSDNDPEGKILGARYEDGFIIQKGYDKLEYGDKLSLYYQERATEANFTGNDINWYKSDEIIVTDELKLDWAADESREAYYSELLTDIWLNRFFTDLLPASALK